MAGSVYIFPSELKYTHWGFDLENLRPLFDCTSIDLVYVQLELAFYYVDVFESIVYNEINIYGRVNSSSNTFNDAVNFHSKEVYCKDTILWNPFLLV